MADDLDLVFSLSLPAYTADLEGRITRYNAAAVELWGRSPVLGQDRMCGTWRLYRSDGSQLSESEHPVARMLEGGVPVAPEELVAERPDGKRIPFVLHPSFLRNEDGSIRGVITLLVRTYDATHHALELERLAAIVATSDDAIISKRLDGSITTWNASATRIFGYLPEEIIGQSILRLIPPELHQEEHDIIARLKRGERIEHYDTTRVGKDGRRINVSLTVSPLRDRTGKIVGASKIARDVTERKRAEELQELLFHELNHRVKNMLGTVQAIASQSLRLAPTPERFVESFSGRLKAIGAAQSLLIQKEMAGADVADLIRDHVTFGEENSPRLIAYGPPVTVGPKMAVQLALVLHELATNARKYGALSVPAGRLEISWNTVPGDPRQLTIKWVETGVPNVSAPTRRGFGTMLITQSLESSGGSASVEYAQDGLRCSLTFPLVEESHALSQSRGAGHTPGAGEGRRRLSIAGSSILLVEDEPLIAMELRDELEKEGAEVRWAPRVDSALQAISEQEFDVAVLDGNLDGRSVDVVAMQLEKDGVPFLFCTGYGSQALPKGFGHVPVIAKPLHMPTLLTTLQKRIRWR